MSKYTEENKLNMIRLYTQGIKVNEIIAKYNISRATIYNWLKGSKAMNKKAKDKGVTLANYEKLQKQLERKTLELNIFQDLHCFKDATIREKEIAISKFVDVYPIKTMCRLLDIPKGTFYNYHLRRKTVTQNQKRDEQLKQEIYKIFKECDGADILD